MSEGIYLFGTDLRLGDNPLLQLASRECDRLALVAVVDERWLGRNCFGGRRAGQRRPRWQLAQWQALDQQLRQQGQRLQLIQGHSATVLAALCEQRPQARWYLAQPCGVEEAQQRALVQQRAAQLTTIELSGLFDAGQLPPLAQLPLQFAPFRRLVSSLPVDYQPLPAPRLPPPLPLPERGPGWQKLADQRWHRLAQHSGSADSPLALMGEAAAGRYWQRYRHHHLHHYHLSRNALDGPGSAVSGLSPLLTVGLLSVRGLWQQLQRWGGEGAEALAAELLWREFFRWSARQHGARLFAQEGFRQRPFQPWGQDRAAFGRWCRGETGIPFVDANMRLLNRCGWMSNRGRQNVASFLVHELQLDWRWGAAYFEQQLVDYDLASNWGNWAYVAGVGADPRSPRRFNILKQAYDYDPEAAFVTAQLPLLAALGAAAHRHGVADAAPARSLPLWQPWLAAAGHGG